MSALVLSRRLSIASAVMLFLPVAPTVAQRTGPIQPRQKAPLEKPAIPEEEIIRRFAEKEAEFRLARAEYSYKQTVLVREYREDGSPGGEFRRNSEVIFLPNGERFERMTYEPPSTLERLSITPEDLHDIENVQPFVLTTEDLPKYAIEYQGREKVDELTTYLFSVRPKRIEKRQRYFEGTIWVDDVDLQIVKTRGKAVPDIREGERENLFPVFETYRENIDGKNWFPTYTAADDLLQFSNGPVRMKIIVRYKDYKKRDVRVRILEDQSAPKPPEP